MAKHANAIMAQGEIATNFRGGIGAAIIHDQNFKIAFELLQRVRSRLSPLHPDFYFH